jgi:hypothetical protein
MRYPRPRFSIRTLLLLLAVVAILCATIWQFWPWFREYQARMRFESVARQFHPGMSVDDINNLAKSATGGAFTSDAKGGTVGAVYYFFDGAWYFVYLELDTTTGIRTSSEQPCTSVRTFRLAVPPIDYQAQTQTAKDYVNPTEHIRSGPDDSDRAPALKGEDARRTAYITDFYQYISGKANADLGIKYEELPTGK